MNAAHDLIYILVMFLVLVCAIAPAAGGLKNWLREECRLMRAHSWPVARLPEAMTSEDPRTRRTLVRLKWTRRQLRRRGVEQRVPISSATAFDDLRFPRNADGTLF